MNAGRTEATQTDDGGAATAELVVMMPLVLLVMMAVVQFALWSHATHIAQAAASQGLAASRAQGGTARDGTTTAQQILDEMAGGPLNDESVSSRRGEATASVRIFGTATSVIPFVRLPVHAEAAGPVERFVPDVGTR